MEEKITRVKREMEEIRLEMVNEKKPADEITEWESLIHSLTPENNATKVLTSRLQKIPSSSKPDSAKVTSTLVLAEVSPLRIHYHTPLQKQHNYQLYHPV